MQTSSDTPKKASRAAKAPVAVETKKRRTPSLAVKAKVAADKALGAPKMRKGAAARLPSAEKPQTKNALVTSMLSRKAGATNQQIMDATGWQTHSVRGFLAHLKKGGVRIEKTIEKDISIYRIVPDEAV